MRPAWRLESSKVDRYGVSGVTDEDLEAELENLKGQYPAEVTGRAAKLGDVANIDT